ncbi:DNA protection during starvation protein [Nitritalea halalkaliphila LW7]|uniref:DNA protection during starvation protein n=1 Tax=Nitritalea halalkaliphila LW7 TaxID=1189621 RepID=I5CAG8_9BACT|nr:Dps family protein [Nitritalea halalkaliphila]EIM78820.1 DNA protection during starvation protein [Nitritalea halalkaliphila LW7]
MSTNQIGLPAKDSKALAEQLNKLLATYEIYYQNLRNFHWNVAGPNFFELHAKFEELYTAATLAIDETAERILTLDQRPYSTFAEFISHAAIQEAGEVKDATEMVRIIRDNITALLQLEREVLEAAGEQADEGTASLMSDYITAKEKVVWMLSAYLR